LSKYNFIKSSDAHYVDNIGNVWTNFFMEELNFIEVKRALRGEEGRRVELR
jgi:hypothetical protein